VTDPRPLGFFDSGVGGLSVVAEVQRLLPYEPLLYYADTRHCPYGERPPEEIRRLAVEASRFLISRGAKLIVVACNTASSAALATLRETFPIPFVGMVPALKPASLASQTRQVLVLATAATVQGEVFAELVAQFAAGVQVHTQSCPGLVELVERGETRSEQVEPLLRRYLRPVAELGIDAVVLGCTHFVFLRQTIQRIVGEGVRVIDTGAAVARQVQRVLREKGLEAGAGGKRNLTLYVSGPEAAFRRALGLLGWEGVRVEPVT
jgi:glutamate racemase